MDAPQEVKTRTGPGGPVAPGGVSGTAPGAGEGVWQGSGPQQKDEVTELVDQAKQTATETASNAGNMVRKRADEQYDKLGRRLDDMVKNMHQAADSLDKEGSQPVSNLVHGAARQMERVSGYMHDTTAEDVLSDANRYARQHPWTVIAGGIALGLVASRFLKAAMPTSDASGQEESWRPR